MTQYENDDVIINLSILLFANRLLEAHPTINDELPFHILTGRVVVRANIKRVFECHVLFEDGVLEEIDDIILATGYDYCFSFLDPNDVNVSLCF